MRSSLQRPVWLPAGLACLVCLLWVCMALASETLLSGFSPVSVIEVFKGFGLVPENWQQYAADFTSFVGKSGRLYMPVLVGVPFIFLVHYLLIGPKSFSHSGGKVWFYSFFTRALHWICAVLFTLLVATGLMIVFARSIGGGSLVLTARSVHLWCAYGFVAAGLPLFIVWFKDMFPAPYDLLWLMKAGGYLSRDTQEIPAGKFNFGQKMWFWLTFVGGAVMFYTGYRLSLLSGSQEEMASHVKIHLILGIFILALFITHLYMSLFAVRGSLRSMISGYKWEEEVKMLHGRMPR